MIYLDHNATTPVHPAVLERMLPFLSGEHGNPSSVHRLGQRARAAVDDAREDVARLLSCEPEELLFTSGGTEADNLALRGTVRPGQRLVVTRVEHPAVLDTARALKKSGSDVVELPVDGRGALDWDAVDRALTPGTALVSAMAANNETGVLFPIEKLGLLCHERGVPLHVDAVQAFGKVPLDLSRLPVDLLSLSAHKLGGPKGTGALFLRRGRSLEPLLTGGHQERGLRVGTENVAGIVGLAAAAQLALSALEETNARVTALAARLRERILQAVPDVRVTADGAPKLAHTLHLCFRGVGSEALLMALDLKGICASGGSACNSGTLEPSGVLGAMGVLPEWSRGALRLSLGPENTAAEIDEVATVLPQVVESLRAHERRS